jgi:hypothetical protein
VFFLSRLGADEPARTQEFDLPAESAEKALKDFAAQSGLEVLFSPQTTADIQTRAVKGDYTPRDAMNRLLAGTALVAAQDGQTGAFNISRDKDEPTSANAKKKME